MSGFLVLPDILLLKLSIYFLIGLGIWILCVIRLYNSPLGLKIRCLSAYFTAVNSAFFHYGKVECSVFIGGYLFVS